MLCRKKVQAFVWVTPHPEVSWIQNPDYVPIHMKYASRGFLMFKHDASIERVYKVQAFVWVTPHPEVSWIQNPDYVPIHMKYASRGFLMFKHDASIERVYTFPRWSP
ncbi:hypothetical protein [Escherichia phage Ecp_YSF]|nr:hypothetical protein [Escherichia phage Ecp_YSF]